MSTPNPRLHGQRPFWNTSLAIHPSSGHRQLSFDLDPQRKSRLPVQRLPQERWLPKKNHADWILITLSNDFLCMLYRDGFHRIRHYGLWSNSHRADNLAKVRDLLDVVPPENNDEVATQDTATFICRSCSAPMIIIAVLPPNHQPRAPPSCRMARQVSP